MGGYDFYSNSRFEGGKGGMRLLLSICLFLSSLHPLFGGLTWDTTYREMKVPAGQKEVLTDFAFKNATSAQIVISSMQTSCGCTVAKIDKKEIAPGESAAVHVRFDVGNRKGEQVKSVVVKTSDQAKQTLILRALIQDPVSFSQKEFVWNSGTPGVERDSMVELSAGAQILGIESLNDQFDAKLEEMEKGSRYRIVVTPRSTAVPVASAVKVLIADPRKRSVLLQARVEN